jgi:hypothetical protein
LPAYVSGELIGRTLIEKTATPADWVVTDNPRALDMRLRLDMPVALWHAGGTEATGLFVQPNLHCHTRFVDDVATIANFVAKLGALDLGEPFVRIREAMIEARKMGVASRAA